MKKTVAILLLCATALLAGTGVAYYNTSSLGYDNANLLTVDEGGFQLFDFDIRYSKLREIGEKITEKLPDKIITI